MKKSHPLYAAQIVLGIFLLQSYLEAIGISFDYATGQGDLGVLGNIEAGEGLRLQGLGAGVVATYPNGTLFNTSNIPTVTMSGQELCTVESGNCNQTVGVAGDINHTDLNVKMVNATNLTIIYNHTAGLLLQNPGHAVGNGQGQQALSPTITMNGEIKLGAPSRDFTVSQGMKRGEYAARAVYYTNITLENITKGQLLMSSSSLNVGSLKWLYHDFNESQLPNSDYGVGIFSGSSAGYLHIGTAKCVNAGSECFFFGTSDNGYNNGSGSVSAGEAWSGSGPLIMYASDGYNYDGYSPFILFGKDVVSIGHPHTTAFHEYDPTLQFSSGNQGQIKYWEDEKQFNITGGDVIINETLEVTHNITMTSWQDGSKWNCGVDSSGSFLCS